MADQVVMEAMPVVATDEVNINSLIGEAGWNFAKTLSVPAKMEYAGRICERMRESEVSTRNTSQLLANLAQTCADLKEFDSVLTAAVKRMKGLATDNTSQGKIVAKLDGVLRTMKSTLRRGFKEGILPSKVYLGYSYIREESKKKADIRTVADKAKQNALLVKADGSVSQAELAKAAKEMQEKLVAWIITIPENYQISFWQQAEPTRVAVDTAFHKALEVLKGNVPAQEPLVATTAEAVTEEVAEKKKRASK